MRNLVGQNPKRPLGGTWWVGATVAGAHLYDVLPVPLSRLRTPACAVRGASQLAPDTRSVARGFSIWEGVSGGSFTLPFCDPFMPCRYHRLWAARSVAV